MAEVAKPPREAAEVIGITLSPLSNQFSPHRIKRQEEGE